MRNIMTLIKKTYFSTLVKHLLMIIYIFAIASGIRADTNNDEKIITLEQEYSKWTNWVLELKFKQSRRILRVGDNKEYKNIIHAAENVRDGDIIEIDHGIYEGSEIIWKANNIIIRAVNGRAHILNNNIIKNGKAIWLVNGDNVLIENIEFSGAKVPDNNGAGIRGAGKNLAIINCIFHDNQNGILVGKKENSTVFIEGSEFYANGFEDGQAHNVYIGAVDALIFRNNYSHNAIIGHNLKSRAKNNYIIYNSLSDEENGKSSYAVDLPNGGMSYLIGNVLQQSKYTQNNALIAFGLEKNLYKNSNLILVNNTFFSEDNNTIYIKNTDKYETILINNLFVGDGRVSKNNTVSKNNYGPISKEKFLDILTGVTISDQNPKILDAGISSLIINRIDLSPMYQPEKTRILTKRKKIGEIDIGAVEYNM